MHVAKRENPIVNRLNKTKVEKEVDHEQERVDRIKKENAAKRSAAVEKVLSTSITTDLTDCHILHRKGKMQNLPNRERQRKPLVPTTF